jgi:hypothetical protein
VPIVAWTGAVDDGAEPTVALVYATPSFISRRRFGQFFGHSPRTYEPPASHTRVTMSLGLGALGSITSSITTPSGASKSG